MTKTYLLRLPEDRHRQFKVLASSLGKTMSELVISWINREIEKKMTVADYLDMPITAEELSPKELKAIKEAEKELDGGDREEWQVFKKRLKKGSK
jgi:predicted DNA-binding protein